MSIETRWHSALLRAVAQLGRIEVARRLRVPVGTVATWEQLPKVEERFRTLRRLIFPSTIDLREIQLLSRVLRFYPTPEMQRRILELLPPVVQLIQVSPMGYEILPERVRFRAIEVRTDVKSRKQADELVVAWNKHVQEVRKEEREESLSLKVIDALPFSGLVSRTTFLIAGDFPDKPTVYYDPNGANFYVWEGALKEFEPPQLDRAAGIMAQKLGYLAPLVSYSRRDVGLEGVPPRSQPFLSPERIAQIIARKLGSAKA